MTFTASTLRISIFALTLIVLIVIECIRPLSQLKFPRYKHYRLNLWVAMINTTLLAMLYLISGYNLSLVASQYHIGLFNLLHLPFGLNCMLGILILDLAIYAQHRLMHRSRYLWRLHQVHHSDPQLDASSGIRFHPLEALFSLLYRNCFILLFGLSVQSILIFEIILNGMSLFSHANIYIPERVDAWLQKLIVTPNMHLIHHTTAKQDQHHNFGFSTSLWDRLFHTYSQTPHNNTIGLREWLPALSLNELIRWPFKRQDKDR